MKKIVFLLTVIVTVSCQKWLDGPSPSGQVEEEKMYETEEGFQNVLLGVYINMAGKNLYGNNMTMTIPELLAQHWKVSSESVFSFIKDYNYRNTEVEELLSDTWQAYFNSIVGLNSLLNEIDAKKHLFNRGNYELIKGEALGLRAFLHFDVLRLWGPIPKGVAATTIAVPYVESVSKNPNDLISLSYQTVLDRILRDLNQAEELLKDDPVSRFPASVLNSPNAANLSTIGDEFHYFRTNRLNIYAVKAIKARYYQWIGEKGEACKYAKEVINAALENGTPVFGLATESTIVADRVMRSEHIFGLQSYNLGKLVLPLFRASDGRYQQEGILFNMLYESVDDIRAKSGRYWTKVEVSETKTAEIYLKYIDADGLGAAQYIPVIRLAEMYLIATENAASLSEALQLFEAFRVARNIPAALIPSDITEGELSTRIAREYQKEFMGEGQMFYHYKRNEVKNFTWPGNLTMIPDNYVVMKPNKQSMFE